MAGVNQEPLETIEPCARRGNAIKALKPFFADVHAWAEGPTEIELEHKDSQSPVRPPPGNTPAGPRRECDRRQIGPWRGSWRVGFLRNIAYSDRTYWWFGMVHECWPLALR